ncbi:MAG TPA: efflux RND transporter periplasmic adaptor subunit [Gemmatales bacterium]|nr:efflux RND transporter periplasmic adaptor subunit [Gemmatales bacterium]
MRRLSILLGVSALVLLQTLAGCQRQRPAPPPPTPPTVTVAQPVSFPVQIYYEYNGNLDAIEMVQVTARVKGFLNEILFKEGDEVKQNDLLFKIDPREYVAATKRADADRRKAVTELKRAKAEEERVKKLRGTGAVSDEDYEQRVAARETAEATLLQTEAALDASQLQLGYTEIHAPIQGQISRTLVTRGNLVGQNENTMLTSIMSMDPIYVYFDVPERDLVEYQRTMQSGHQSDLLNRTLPLEIAVATETGYPHAGVIDFRENHVDMGTGTVRIRGRIPNPRVQPGNVRVLYPGLFAKIRVPSGPATPLLCIPEDALMTGQEGRYVYVLDDKNNVTKRSVTVGPAVWKAPPVADPNQPGWTLTQPGSEAKTEQKPIPVPAVIAIASGLKAGDRIVINGLTKARPGSPVTPEERELKPPPATDKK